MVDWLYGMTTFEEQAFCRTYAARDLTGAGAVVDLGCWLGSSTVALVQGMAQHPSPDVRRGRVHAYDRFLWHGWMEPIVQGTPLAGRYAQGDSFLGEFEARVAPWRDHIEVHVEDLTRSTWRGGAIEFLFVDAMKDRELTTTIAREFFPALLPGAIVLHHDYVYPWCPWIHMLMARLKHRFEPVAAIPDSYGVAFRVRDPVLRAEAEAAGAGQWCEEEILQAFALASTLVTGPGVPRLWAAQLVALTLEGHTAAIERELADDRVREGVSAEPEAAGALAWCRAQAAAR